MKKSNSLHALFRSTVFAANGIRVFFKTGVNARIQAIIGALALLLAYLLDIGLHNWVVIISCIASVLMLEMINTAIEKLCDLAHPGFHPQIKIIKDMAAGAVLLASLASVVIGILVFLPYLCLFIYPCFQ
jgi:diacylglycerol kinase